MAWAADVRTSVKGYLEYLQIIQDVDCENRNRGYQHDPIQIPASQKFGEMQDKYYKPEQINNY